MFLPIFSDVVMAISELVFGCEKTSKPNDTERKERTEKQDMKSKKVYSD
jgi:hypothetical protein